MSDYFNEEYKQNTLKIILDNLKDLEEWSTNNNDKYLGIIQMIIKLITALQEDKV